MPRILIIGGSRFVGPHLLKLLQQDDSEITVFNRGNHKMDYGTSTYVKGDRLKDLSKVSNRDFDVVYDMCAYNGKHTQTMLDSIKFDFLVHFGTVASYTIPISYPVKETQPQGESIWGDYGKGKAECEIVLANAGIKYTSIRPTYILGARNYVNRENFIYKGLLTNTEFLVPGNGRALTQFVFVDEVAQSLYLAGKNKVEGAFNCAGDEYVTLITLLTEMGEIVGKKPIIEFDMKHDREKWDDEIFPFANDNFIFDNNKIKQELGIKFTPLLDSLKKDWEDYYKDNLR